MADDLIVSLDEFSDLCDITPETMRVHLRALKHDPIWLIERGDRGRPYKIEARGGVEWWKQKVEDDAHADDDRKKNLAQLRLDIVGDKVEEENSLTLTGRQRKEEYDAAFRALEYRKTMGELLEKTDFEAALTAASVDLRRRLMQIPAEYIISQSLPKKHTKPLLKMIEAAVNEFLDSIQIDEIKNAR